MLVGQIIARLERDDAAAELLLAQGDLVLLARVQDQAERHDETVADYAAFAIRRFSNQASSEDWLALMTALETSGDPGTTVLTRMIEWAVAGDAAEVDGGAADHHRGHVQVGGQGHHDHGHGHPAGHDQAAGRVCTCGGSGGCAS